MQQIPEWHLVCGRGNVVFIIVFNVLLITFLWYFALKNYDKFGNIYKVSIAMILGGGIGNLTDRLLRGHVIDYIDINRFFQYPLFNFADICIVMGCILIVFNLVIETIKKQENE